MYQFNEQFAAASRQFADSAAQINRIALENVQALFGLQVNAIEERANATFAFFGEAAQARDLDALKTLWPKGVQVARENVERAVAVSQDVYARTLKPSARSPGRRSKPSPPTPRPRSKKPRTRSSRLPRPSKTGLAPNRLSLHSPSGTKNPAAPAAGYFVAGRQVYAVARILN